MTHTIGNLPSKERLEADDCSTLVPGGRKENHAARFAKGIMVVGVSAVGLPGRSAAVDARESGDSGESCSATLTQVLSAGTCIDKVCQSHAYTTVVPIATCCN